MSDYRYKPVRLRYKSNAPYPSIQRAMPPLPAVAWNTIGATAPSLLPSSSASDPLPQADAVIITWLAAEWAALDQVFCETTSMPNSSQYQSRRTGWTPYAANLLAGQNPTWTFWGYYRLVQINNAKVLLFKSNTHSVFPGIEALQALVALIIKEVNPSLFLTIGTAGATCATDPFGALHIGNQCTLYAEPSSGKQSILYKSSWNPPCSATEKIRPLWNSIPITIDDLAFLQCQYNAYYKSDYTLDQLCVFNRNMEVSIDVPSTSLITSTQFLVGNSSGDFASYSCIETDDAFIAEVCEEQKVNFGFVRNISDPIQNAQIPKIDQVHWAGIEFGLAGFYTSYNGALAAWAIIDAEFL